jgi:hypothetical protein
MYVMYSHEADCTCSKSWTEILSSKFCQCQIVSKEKIGPKSNSITFNKKAYFKYFIKISNPRATSEFTTTSPALYVIGYICTYVERFFKVEKSILFSKRTRLLVAL